MGAVLEDLTSGAVVRGVTADGPATVVAVEWHGSSCVMLTPTASIGLCQRSGRGDRRAQLDGSPPRIAKLLRAGSDRIDDEWRRGRPRNRLAAQAASLQEPNSLANKSSM